VGGGASWSTLRRWCFRSTSSSPRCVGLRFRLADANAIQAVTPSDIYSWPGPDVPLIGRVAALNVEKDGDIHIALQDATGDNPGIVVAEVPAKPQWSEIRKTVVSWTQMRFPFHTSSLKKLKSTEAPIRCHSRRLFPVWPMAGTGKISQPAAIRVRPNPSAPYSDRS
jgi:hypothetical protein